MRNTENSEGLFQDVGDVENFKITLGAKLRVALRYNYGICHIQAMLGEAITRQSSQTEAALISSVQVAIYESLGQQIPPETISSLVRNALTEALTDDFGEGVADEVYNDGYRLRRGKYDEGCDLKALDFDL
ncbi:MAG: hypothetical protein ABID64_05045 [Nitrospirota bacterium]